MMSEPRRIEPVLVEKAVDAYEHAIHEMPKSSYEEGIEAVIRVVRAHYFDELGLKEEHQAARQAMVGPPEAPWQELAPCVRLVSDWRPVEQGDTK